MARLYSKASMALLCYDGAVVVNFSRVELRLDTYLIKKWIHWWLSASSYRLSSRGSSQIHVWNYICLPQVLVLRWRKTTWQNRHKSTKQFNGPAWELFYVHNSVHLVCIIFYIEYTIHCGRSLIRQFFLLFLSAFKLNFSFEHNWLKTLNLTKEIKTALIGYLVLS